VEKGRTTEATSNEWKRYGKALIQSMREVLDETDQPVHSPLLETADYWFSVGLAIGVKQPRNAQRILALVEAQEEERARLDEDATFFCAEVLG
jgi:hypothetical protein